MDEVEIPQYFLCPISLMIMKDPVTTVTGITYDRESIEVWLVTAEEDMATTCPVTKQNLPRDIELLTPNHMLRRLIQAWCIANASNGIDRIPTPKYPLDKSHMLRLVRQVNNHQLCAEALKKIDALVIENEKNRKCLEEVGAIKAMVSFIVRNYKERKLINGLEEALKIFHLVWRPTTENEQLVKENRDLIVAILWILRSDMTKNQVILKTQAMMVLKNVTEVSSSNLLSGLDPEFFQEMVNMLRKESKHHISQQATKAALQVLVHACSWGRNKQKIIESGAIFELIELELCNTEKRVSELVLCVLAHLCTLADGRAEFLKHAAGIGVVTKRTLRVSSSTDDCAIQILGSISKCSATSNTLTLAVKLAFLGNMAFRCVSKRVFSTAFQNRSLPVPSIKPPTPQRPYSQKTGDDERERVLQNYVVKFKAFILGAGFVCGSVFGAIFDPGASRPRSEKA